MKRIIDFVGGRALLNDDIEALQSQIDLGFGNLFLGEPAFVIYGCKLSNVGGNYQLSSGLLWLNQKLVLFSGASNILIDSGARLVEADPNLMAERRYQLLNTYKPGIEQRSAVFTNTPPAWGESLMVNLNGPVRTIAHGLSALVSTPIEYPELLSDFNIIDGAIGYHILFGNTIKFLGGGQFGDAPNSGDVLFQLPENLRPTSVLKSACVVHSEGIVHFGWLSVDNLGNLRAHFNGSTKITHLYLDGVTFQL